MKRIEYVGGNPWVTSLLIATILSQTNAWTASPAVRSTTTISTTPYSMVSRFPPSSSSTQLFAQPAGSFFNPVPEDKNDNNDIPNNQSKPPKDEGATPTNPLELNSNSFPYDNDDDDISDPFETNLRKILEQRNAPSRASQPSTIDGKPTAGQGFGVKKSSSTSNISNKSIQSKTPEKPYVGIGPRSLNDPTKPEYDDQGYTLYRDEQTGEQSRVFEALVDYPCDFTMKIVGANEGMFVQEMVAVVAESCEVQVDQVPHSVRVLGKWMSVTVQAPVQSAEMLYQLYENVDRDPRVRFKF